MVAALSPDHKALTLAVVNATDSEQNFDLNVSSARLDGNARVWQMTGKDLDAADHLGQPVQVEVKEAAIGEAPTRLSVPPNSVNIYRFDVARGAP
jgi:alpha-N-arabinofuranosidase